MIHYEYKIVQLDLNETQLLMSRANTQVLKETNDIIEVELNKYGKDGWLLHASGITTIPVLVFYKEIIKNKSKKRHNK